MSKKVNDLIKLVLKVAPSIFFTAFSAALVTSGVYYYNSLTDETPSLSEGKESTQKAIRKPAGKKYEISKSIKRKPPITPRESVPQEEEIENDITPVAATKSANKLKKAKPPIPTWAKSLNMFERSVE
ncbi:MAG: hypothetical protein ACOCUH_00740, partial [Bacteriovoracia bacterium]